MKKINIVLASSSAAVLLAAAPLLASAHNTNVSANAGAQVQTHSDNGLHLGIIASLFGKNHDGDKDADKNEGHKVTASSTTNATVRVGTVSAVNGSAVTLTGFFGRKHATSTVSTASSTVYKVNGQATTSSALTAGDHVLITGTTTANGTFTASIVNIFTRGWGFFKHHLFH
jgi:hypothetical protein